MCCAAWYIACQTLMTFAVVFEFLALAVFPCCLVFPQNTKWLWAACFVTGMISKSQLMYTVVQLAFTVGSLISCWHFTMFLPARKN